MIIFSATCLIKQRKDYVRQMLTRISRDRYISPSEYRRLSRRVASRVSGHEVITLKAAMPMECEHVGLWRGVPPVSLGHPRYLNVLRAIKKAELLGDKHLIELAVLKEFI